MKRLGWILAAVILAAASLGALQVPPPAAPPRPAPTVPQIPTVPAPPVPAAMAMPSSPSSPSTDIYLLAALRAQDAKIAELEARLLVLEKRAGVKR